MHLQRVYVGGCLQPGTALVVVCLAVVTLPPRSTAPTVAGCRLVGCSVVRGLPLCSCAVTGMLRHVSVGLGPVLASHVPSPIVAAAAAADWDKAWEARTGPRHWQADTDVLIYFLFLQEQIKDIIIRRGRGMGGQNRPQADADVQWHPRHSATA